MRRVRSRTGNASPKPMTRRTRFQVAQCRARVLRGVPQARSTTNLAVTLAPCGRSGSVGCGPRASLAGGVPPAAEAAHGEGPSQTARTAPRGRRARRAGPSCRCARRPRARVSATLEAARGAAAGKPRSRRRNSTVVARRNVDDVDGRSEVDGDGGATAGRHETRRVLAARRSSRTRRTCANDKAGGDRVGGGGGGGTRRSTTPLVVTGRPHRRRARVSLPTTWSTPGGAHKRRTHAVGVARARRVHSTSMAENSRRWQGKPGHRDRRRAERQPSPTRIRAARRQQWFPARRRATTGRQGAVDGDARARAACPCAICSRKAAPQTGASVPKRRPV